MWCRDVHIPFFEGLVGMSQCIVALKSDELEQDVIDEWEARSKSNQVTYCGNKEFAINPAKRSFHMFTRNHSKSLNAQFKKWMLQYITSSRKRERETETQMSVHCCKMHAKCKRRCNQISTHSKWICTHHQACQWWGFCSEVHMFTMVAPMPVATARPKLRTGRILHWWMKELVAAAE